MFPRSFFACDSDWQQLVALVKHKLPEKKARPAPEADPSVPSPIEGDQGAIHGQTRLAYRDFLAAYRNVAGRWRLRLVQAVGLAIVVAPLLVATAVPSGPGPVDFLVVLGAVALLGWLVVVAPWRGLLKLARRHQGPFAVGAIAVSEEGVAQQQRFARMKFRWNYFVGHRQLPGCILLYFPSHSRMHILARSYFSDADWSAVVALVERKLPRV